MPDVNSQTDKMKQAKAKRYTRIVDGSFSSPPRAVRTLKVLLQLEARRKRQELNSRRVSKKDHPNKRNVNKICEEEMEIEIENRRTEAYLFK